MSIEITWNGVALALFIIMAAVLVIYIVKTLININKTLTKVNIMLEDNKKNINDSIKNLPEITSNINEITKSIKGKTDVLDNILGTNDDVASSLSFDIEGLITSITSFIGIFSELKDWFRKKKKRPGLRRK